VSYRTFAETSRGFCQSLGSKHMVYEQCWLISDDMKLAILQQRLFKSITSKNMVTHTSPFAGKIREYWYGVTGSRAQIGWISSCLAYSGLPGKIRALRLLSAAVCRVWNKCRTPIRSLAGCSRDDIYRTGFALSFSITSPFIEENWLFAEWGIRLSSTGRIACFLTVILVRGLNRKG